MASTSLLGASKAMQAAASLLESGIQVFTPVTDLGADLVICNIDYSNFIPIQVKYKKRDPSLKLDGKEVEKYKGRNLWFVFFVGEAVWSLPFDAWLEKSTAPPRGDNARYINKNDPWLAQYKGFNKLVEAIKCSET